MPPCLLFIYLFFFLAAGFARDSGSPAKKKTHKKKLETPKRRRESLFTLLCVFKKLKRVKQARRVSLPTTLYGDGSVFIVVVFSSLTPPPPIPLQRAPHFTSRGH